jgi:hypothetical protein
MKRSTRLAALIAALMLLAACMSATPSWALLGPIKEQEPENIGDPDVPDGSRALYSPPGYFTIIAIGGTVFELKLPISGWFVRIRMREASSRIGAGIVHE